MNPRWKFKGAEAKAISEPMSQIVSQLQSCLVQLNSHGLLTGSCVVLEADVEQTQLLNRACFGRLIITASSEDDDKQWFQLSMAAGFYLCYVLTCTKVVGENLSEKNCEELWTYMKLQVENFPNLFKAYSHLRMKNWVVRSGSQYGVDFVAYRHHGRLAVWSDLHCTLRLCGGVAKTLLVLYVDKCGSNTTLPSCLESYTVEERTINQVESGTMPREEQKKCK